MNSDSQVCPWEETQIRLLRDLTRTRDGALNFVLKIVEFLQATPSTQLSWKLLCFLFKSYIIRKNIKKIRAKSAKFGFLLVVWPRGEVRWAFVLIVLCCFFLCDLLCLPYSHLFVYRVLGFEHLLDYQQFLLWTFIQLSFTALKFAYISHHILPSKLHLLLSSAGPLQSPHALLVTFTTTGCHL
jgi:hypothetical protein